MYSRPRPEVSSPAAGSGTGASGPTALGWGSERLRCGGPPSRVQLQRTVHEGCLEQHGVDLHLPESRGLHVERVVTENAEVGELSRLEGPQPVL